MSWVCLLAVCTPFGVTLAFSGAGAVWLTDDGQDLTDFHDSFEVSQVVVNLLLWFFAEELCHPPAELTGGRIILEHDLHVRAAVAGSSREFDRAAVLDVATGQCAPSNARVWLIGRDFRIPFDLAAGDQRRLGHPVGSSIFQKSDGLQ